MEGVKIETVGRHDENLLGLLVLRVAESVCIHLSISNTKCWIDRPNTKPNTATNNPLKIRPISINVHPFSGPLAANYHPETSHGLPVTPRVLGTFVEV